MTAPWKLSFTVVLSTVLVTVGVWAFARQNPAQPNFNHEVHAALFPGSCVTCHLGAGDPSAPLYPPVQSCGNCHDGSIQSLVTWAAPIAAPPSNLRFTHPRHQSATADSVSCLDCHSPDGDRRHITRRLAANCVNCHEPGREHLAATGSDCATCHLALTEATGLGTADLARFPMPEWHQAPEYRLGGHGSLANAAPGGGVTAAVAATCVTCHARTFCENCHVNAPEVPAIQALLPDERVRIQRFNFEAPPSHQRSDYQATHGREVGNRGQSSCAACHTRESCLACHVASTAPRQIGALHPAGPGRAPGAQIERKPPSTHTLAFTEDHGGMASAQPRSCANCHARTECLSCHRPDPSSPSGGGDYHPSGFLTRHPAAAYSRQSTCADCHNAQQFCASCHAQSGLSAKASLGSSTYHDGRQAFIVGHGQAARQALESCVSCHVERDCTACHSSVGRGFRFSPHGPGFDPERLRRRNPEMCIACHGTAIPGLARTGRP